MRKLFLITVTLIFFTNIYAQPHLYRENYVKRQWIGGVACVGGVVIALDGMVQQEPRNYIQMGTGVLVSTLGAIIQTTNTYNSDWKFGIEYSTDPNPHVNFKDHKLGISVNYKQFGSSLNYQTLLGGEFETVDISLYRYFPVFKFFDVAPGGSFGLDNSGITNALTMRERINVNDLSLIVEQKIIKNELGYYYENRLGLVYYF